ncbi:MerR family transcriptional regulator [Roseburia hominis]
MEYSIRELSELAGVSARTLRYYDEIGLLKPLYVTEAGYRFYGENELAILQQILFYRERKFDLQRIRKILYEDDFDLMSAMEEHLRELEEQREHVDLLIRTVKQTILSMKGEYHMNDQEKFEAFKKHMVRENEAKYGKEIREKYGDDTVADSNRKLLNMSQKDWERFKELETEILAGLRECVQNELSPGSEEAKKLVSLHKEWLRMTWKQYSVEAHKGIAKMYVSDERFRAYYDSEVPGCAAFLEQAVARWADRL